MINEERLKTYYDKGQSYINILKEGLESIYFYCFEEEDFIEMVRDGYSWQLQDKEDKARKNLKSFYDTIKNEIADQEYVQYYDHMHYMALIMMIKGHLLNRRYISATSELIHFIDGGEFLQSRYLENFKMLLSEEFKNET